MTTPLGYDELLQCPFEKAHRVQAHAMSKHLFKCQKNHRNMKFITCPFNGTHRVAADDLKIHVAECKDRGVLDTYKYPISTSAANVPSPADLVYNTRPPTGSSVSHNNNVNEECWDNMDAPAYNPEVYCAKAKVIRKATLKTPSEKKAFYESERLRLQDLKLTD
ncbi:gametocyte-specific factor 1 homolog [Sabethes cyaneus]|uniref:gametocyte-specific factor 1 homolog n=1 Tax=Sabethes cyaneus TaxID=53552 RepID=UPI00237D6346|nr:gametocyte-specific factor 1 homolog [Sabethes cyaneus]